MPWNNQGGGGWQSGQGGPWGGRPGGGGGGQGQPPDLEELIRRSQEKVKRLFPGGGGGSGGGVSKRAVVIAVLGVAAIWLASGFYRVQPEEQGVELVFGQLHETTTPGLNYNWPAPIGSVETPQVTRVNRIEIGFRSGQRTAGSSANRNVADEALILTGDENIVDINFVVLWKIANAADYLFNIRDPEQTVTAAQIPRPAPADSLPSRMMRSATSADARMVATWVVATAASTSPLRARSKISSIWAWISGVMTAS